MNRISISPLIIAILFSSLASAQKTKVAGDNFPQLFEKYIQEALQQWKTPGLAVVVVKDHQVVFKKAFGVRDKRTNVAYTTSTLSTCASTTKAMTAVCLGMLVDEGRVKWNDVVANIFPEFKLSNPYLTAEVKVKDLLTHNAGLGNADLLWVFGYTPAEIIRRMQFIPPAYSLRASFIYQNLMYLVAGELIKKVSGKSWSEFITDRIFKPLGMNATHAAYSTIAPEEPKTTPHFKDRNLNDSIKTIEYLSEDNVGPAGGVWSCADDMAKWLQFLLDSAQFNGKRFLKAETFAELFKPQAIVPESEFYPTIRFTRPHWMTYGLGWFQHDYRGKMVQFHTGSLDGLVAIAGMIPDDRIAVYVFGNLDHSEIRHALMYKAFDLWSFRDNKTDWSADLFNLYKGFADSAKKREADQLAKRVTDTRPSLPLTAYVGKYVNEIYGAVDLLIEKDSLILNLPDGISLRLRHWNYDTFQGEYNYWWFGKSFVHFSVNTEGNISALSLEGISFNKENRK